MIKIPVAALVTAGLFGAEDADAKGLQGGEVRIGIATTLLEFATVTMSDPVFGGPDTKIDSRTIGISGDSLGAQVGYAATRNIEVGGLLGVTDQKLSNPDGDQFIKLSRFRVGLYGNYNIPIGVSSFYLEGLAALTDTGLEAGDSFSSQRADGQGWTFGVGGGIKAFFAEAGSFDAGARLYTQTLDVEDENNDPIRTEKTTGFIVHIGISIWLGGRTPAAQPN